MALISTDAGLREEGRPPTLLPELARVSALSDVSDIAGDGMNETTEIDKNGQGVRSMEEMRVNGMKGGIL